MNQPTNEREVKVGKQVLREDDLEFTVQYNGELFTLRLPTPYERAAIEAEIARKLGGYPRDSFPANHLALVEATSYVDLLVVHDKSPAWFKSAWTCYDEVCIETLYRGFLRVRTDFQERFRPDRSEEGS